MIENLKLTYFCTIIMVQSLCNACGIRQRKARRAMAAAAAAANGTILAAANPPSMKSKVQHKDKKSSNGYVPKFKKKCKPNTPTRGRKKLCFEDFTISLSKNSAFQRVSLKMRRKLQSCSWLYLMVLFMVEFSKYLSSNFRLFILELGNICLSEKRKSCTEDPKSK